MALGLLKCLQHALHACIVRMVLQCSRIFRPYTLRHFTRAQKSPEHLVIRRNQRLDTLQYAIKIRAAAKACRSEQGDFFAMQAVPGLRPLR